MINRSIRQNEYINITFMVNEFVSILCIEFLVSFKLSSFVFAIKKKIYEDCTLFLETLPKIRPPPSKISEYLWGMARFVMPTDQAQRMT